MGVEYYTTWWPAHEIVDRYVADVAPERHAELREHLDRLEPAADTETAFQHAQLYMGVTDKKPFVDHARAAYALVEELAPRRSVARHAARQILSFYENYYLPFADAVNYRDARAAENLRWRRETGHRKIVYWAASPHTARTTNLRITAPPEPDMVFASVGSYLDRWYGNDYSFMSGGTLGQWFDVIVHRQEVTAAAPL